MTERRVSNMSMPFIIVSIILLVKNLNFVAGLIILFVHF